MTLEQHIRAAEKQYVLAALKDCNWNMTQVAKTAGVHRTHIYRLMARNNIQLPEHRRISFTPQEARTWRQACAAVMGQ